MRSVLSVTCPLSENVVTVGVGVGVGDDDVELQPVHTDAKVTSRRAQPRLNIGISDLQNELGC